MKIMVKGNRIITRNDLVVLASTLFGMRLYLVSQSS